MNFPSYIFFSTQGSYFANATKPVKRTKPKLYNTNSDGKAELWHGKYYILFYKKIQIDI